MKSTAPGRESSAYAVTLERIVVENTSLVSPAPKARIDLDIWARPYFHVGCRSKLREANTDD